MTLLPRGTCRLGWLLLLLVLAGSVWGQGQPKTAKVVARPFFESLTSYAEIKAPPTLILSAQHRGQLDSLPVEPGTAVAAGQVLARIGGPALNQELALARQRVKTAKASNETQAELLAFTRKRQRHHYAARDEVLRAQIDADKAAAQLVEAQSALAILKAQQTVVAPAAGVVVARKAVGGQRLAPGDPVVAFQERDPLSLQARFFGQAASSIATGQAARFIPDDGTAPISLTVTHLYRDPEGSWVATLTPAQAQDGQPANWLAGEAGTVHLDIPHAPALAVPSRALILDQGRWWVMLGDGEQGHPVAVDPIERRQKLTWVRGDLHEGDQVLVSGAYQVFHKQFAARFQLPD